MDDYANGLRNGRIIVLPTAADEHFATAGSSVCVHMGRTANENLFSSDDYLTAGSRLRRRIERAGVVYLSGRASGQINVPASSLYASRTNNSGIVDRQGHCVTAIGDKLGLGGLDQTVVAHRAGSADPHCDVWRAGLLQENLRARG